MPYAVEIAPGAPLRGLRLHGVAPRVGTPSARKVEWLRSLAVQQQQQQADRQALAGVAQAIQRALQALTPTVNARLDQVAALAVELGLAVAREVVGAALDRGFVDPTPTVARCLRDCVHGSKAGDLVVRVHPEDLGLVMAGVERDPELRAQMAAAKLQPDASLGRGAVRAETGAGRLVWEPREAFERIAEQVRREASA